MVELPIGDSFFSVDAVLEDGPGLVVVLILLVQVLLVALEREVHHLPLVTFVVEVGPRRSS